MNAAGYGGSRAQPGYEAPACVQNAMMTKDKKPFTYTPGGIDLSQIKSERMAKRLARNAQADSAATGIAQQNRPSPPVSTGTASASNVGAAAMGVPFQVLPPPPPPSVGGKQQNSLAYAPPPPPPPVGTKLAPPNSNNTLSSPTAARKSPTPQRFEPPPMGLRPEIKIPPNPIASLRKVAAPVEKNTFWKDEYIKERSKSPLVSESGYENSQQNDAKNNNDRLSNSNSNGTYSEKNDATDGIKTSMKCAPPNAGMYIVNKGASQTTPSQPPFNDGMKSNLPTQPQSPIKSMNYMRQSDSPLVDSQRISINQQQAQPIPVQQNTATGTTIINQVQPSGVNSIQEQTHQPQLVPWRTQRSQKPEIQQQKRANQQQTDNISAQQQHPSPIFEPSTQQNQFRESPKPTSIGSLYIAPITPPKETSYTNTGHAQFQQQQQRNSPTRQATSLAQQQHQQQSQQHQQQQQQQQLPQQQHPQQQQPQQQSTLRQPARWMTSQPPPREQPEWVRPSDNDITVPSSIQHLTSPPPSQTYNSPPLNQTQFGNQIYNMPTQNFGARNSAQVPTSLHLQINNASDQRSTPRERIIPITLEQTPTNVLPQPNFNTASPGYIVRSPNQFVDQGYNNFPNKYLQNQQYAPGMNIASPIQTTGGPRIIPIAIESGGNETIHHQPPSTVVLPNDQRTPPIQSKSFRVLQKITDTSDDNIHGAANNGTMVSNNDSEPQLQRPQFARQMSAQQARNCPNVEQMRRLQIGQNQDNTHPSPLSDQQQVHTNIDISKSHTHPSNQKVIEPKIYSGSAIPSRSFKILQSMTTPENAGPGQSDL